MRQVFPEQQPYFGFVREELLLLMNLLHLKHVHISTNTRPQGKKSQQMIGISDTLERPIGAWQTAARGRGKIRRGGGAVLWGRTQVSALGAPGNRQP